MNGPHTLLTIEAVLGERAREVELAESLARLHWGTPRVATLDVQVTGWLRELVSRLAPPPAQPQCCPQIV